jgi:RNA polymerase sigma-70 factor (ECF subfamily)
MKSSERLWRERGLRNAVLAGDEQAWRSLYAQSFDDLAVYVQWRCAGLRDLADEIVQETWLTAVRRIRVFEPERGSFANWLCGIAANLLRNHLRRQEHRGREPLDEVQASTKTAEASLEQREEAERIVHALAALPEHYEMVLRAKYLDGLNVGAIAELRGESIKSVESLLTRARQAFRDVYQRQEQPHERVPRSAG